MSELVRTLLVAGLVGLNAFFVIGEYAMVTARRHILTQRAVAGNRGAEAALRLMDDPVALMSTVQVGITAVGILTGALGAPVVRDLLGGGVPAPIGFLLAFATLTLVTIVFGELVPKAISLDRAEVLAARVARPILVVRRLLAPIVATLQYLAGIALRPFGISRVIAGMQVRSADELRAMIDEAERTGVIPRAQEELLYNVFDFASREAGDEMVPSSQVVWLEAQMSSDEACERVIESARTRFPVCEGSLDRPIGIVHARDIMRAVRRGGPDSVGELARTALVVPETKDLGALLREMRETREQMAVVVTEYGRTAGIITLEDILEEIVGEIEGEYELPESRLTWLDDATLAVAGSMSIDDFNEMTAARLPQDGPRTLAGLVFEKLGRGPVVGDRVAVGGVELSVERVAGARIARLRVSLPRVEGR